MRTTIRDWKNYYERLAQNTDDFLVITGREKFLDKKVFEYIFFSIDRHLKFNSSDIVLDIGCGTGSISVLIAKRCKKVIAIDFSFNSLRKGLLKYFHIKNLKFINANAIFLPIKDNSIDKIVCYSLVLYLGLGETEKLFKELYRVLKPGGVVFIGDNPDIEKENKYYRFFLKKYLSKIKSILLSFFKKPDYHITWFSKDWFYNKAEKYNFKCICVEQPSVLPYSYYRFDVILQK